MFKRNLIAIVMTSLALIFTSSVFGQWHKDFPDAYRKNLKVIKTSQVKVSQKRHLATKNFGADMMEGSNIRQKKPNRRRFDHIGNFKAPTKHFGADMLEGTNIRRKQPRDRRR